MEIFRNSNGYAPLLVNLEPYFEKPFAELPNEIKEIINGHHSLLTQWDSWNAEQRRHLAAQQDYEKDPTREPVLRYEIENFHTRLGELIAEAEHHREHEAVTYLRKVEDRIRAIKEIDREKVGSAIKQLREGAAAPQRANTSEKTCLNIIEALLRLLIPHSRESTGQRNFGSQQELIDEINDKHSNWYGISERNLQKVFANARRGDRER